jgi:diguanylate cyclase (GGDEF)-like protein
MAAALMKPIDSPSHRSMFERALDALPDGVLLTDSARKVVYCNPAFAKHWMIPDGMIASGNEIHMLNFVQGQLIDPAAFIREVERINPTTESSEDELYLKDGRVLSRRSVPFEENGVFSARLWIFNDVTDARYARIDTLCNIPNRRAYSTNYPTFVEAPDDGLLKSVGILDIDNFKAYNDRYGHAAGDLVLREIGALLRERTVKADDQVFRIGGEEFLFACKTRKEGDSLGFFEAVRASVAALGLKHDGNAPHGTVTVSIGICTFRGARNPSALFEKVDAALYRAKSGGRNRIEIVGTQAA